jgi:hypothetical protein
MNVYADVCPEVIERIFEPKGKGLQVKSGYSDLTKIKPIKSPFSL